MRLWVDTDVGDNPDDAVALALAARHPAAELVGVSTVDGDVERRAAEATEILAALGVDVPVEAGSISPSSLRRADAFLAIGPLTNVARVVEHLPTRVVIMGGATREVRHRGTTTRVEHNFGADPAAASTVLRLAPRCTVVPLEVTARMRIDDEQTAALARAVPALSSRFSRWRAQHNSPVCLHDPLALLVLLDDAPVRREPHALRVGADGALHIEARDAAVHELVTDVDAREALSRLLSALTFPH